MNYHVSFWHSITLYCLPEKIVLPARFTNNKFLNNNNKVLGYILGSLQISNLAEPLLTNKTTSRADLLILIHVHIQLVIMVSSE